MSSIRCMGCMKEYDGSFDICPHCGYARIAEAKEDNQLTPGTILHNKYVVGKILGSGANGITYLGWDAILEIKVVIKEYFPKGLANRLRNENLVSTYDGDREKKYKSGLESFLNAGKNLLDFNYFDIILTIYDSFSENNTGYVIMEYIEGVSLQDTIEKQGKKSFEDTISIVAPILNALSDLHNRGIIHGNICPENILLTDSGIKLIDFNFGVQSKSDVKQNAISVGYSPIEAYRSNGVFGPWTDIYALCATMYFMLTSKAPVESIQRVEEDTLPDITKYASQIPSNCVNAIMNGLNVDPRNRIQTVDELGSIFSGTKNMKRIKGEKSSGDIGKKSKKGLIVAIIISLVVLLAGGAVLTYAIFDTSITDSATNKDQIDLDSLRGKSGKEAEAYARKFGMTAICVDSKFDDKIAEKENIKVGTIIDAVIDENDKTVIKYTLYAGKKTNPNADVKNQVTVPNLYGMKESKARKLLREYSLNCSVKYKANDSFVGCVFKQSKKAGTKVETQSTINIVVGKPEPTTATTTTTTAPPQETQQETQPTQQNNNYQNNNNQNYTKAPVVTQAPATQAPATKASVTQAPATQPPTTQDNGSAGGDPNDKFDF